MRHKLTEENYFKMFLELMRTVLPNDKPIDGDDNEDIDNTRDTDSDNTLQ